MEDVVGTVVIYYFCLDYCSKILSMLDYIIYDY